MDREHAYGGFPDQAQRHDGEDRAVDAEAIFDGSSWAHSEGARRRVHGWSIRPVTWSEEEPALDQYEIGQAKWNSKIGKVAINLSADVGGMSAQTRRHYATIVLAMLKRAKAERIIKSHQLDGIILPEAPQNGDPQPWTRHELGVITGAALNAYEADQAAWNVKVATEKKNRGLRSPSVVPLRGYCLIAYYTMMRPDCNLHLRWDEVS